MSEKTDVSRAEGKLAGAVRAFSFDFRGKTVLDIGSSTGGFTEFALKAGAKKVIAVEKGTDQMKAPLRFDPRIELFEKTDIFDVSLDIEGEQGNVKKVILKEVPDVILTDVSFISLTKVLAYAKMYLARRKTDFLVMFKPQFEAKDFQLNKGVVKNEKMRREIIKDFEFWLKKNGFLVINKRDNDVFGKNGNIERFYYLKLEKPIKNA
ncbi:TlyA family rRNA (cytidine-2'-O)-methyltransferase [Candidatus Saccharibacteria bacterium]|nr:TlyA family rRNA (cytidine-2'-O)-methyltransferase [Candidatus Saccharibacteria bacterium]